jgi:serine/threonine-protein kinase SRPK3
VVTASGDTHRESTAPQYLVYPTSWGNTDALGTNFITDKACVINFSKSYEVSNPPPDLSIPQIYCSPEYTLDKKIGTGSDLWALACTLFEIRIGSQLFDTYDNEIHEYLSNVALMLGKFPEPWWSTTWERRHDFFDDEADAEGRLYMKLFHPVGNNEGIMMVHRQGPPSLQDAIARGMYHESRYGPVGTSRDITQEEIDLFSDLLAGMLRYAPEGRLTAKDVLEHSWFNL